VFGSDVAAAWMDARSALCLWCLIAACVGVSVKSLARTKIEAAKSDRAERPITPPKNFMCEALHTEIPGSSANQNGNLISLLARSGRGTSCRMTKEAQGVITSPIKFQIQYGR
jgi:hypothetical protein